MNHLLMTQFVQHYHLSIFHISDWYEETIAPYFEIEDTNTHELKLHTNKNCGMARFANPNGLKFIIVNYDKFITSIADESFKHGKQRCDMMINSVTEHYFILGELKDRMPNTKVRSAAKKQLLVSLQTLWHVPEIQRYIDSKVVKRCCYFNKQASAPNGINAIQAFNRLSNHVSDGIQMNSPEIESMGFDFYEYTGMQMMTFIN